jgi:hypothetical protein
MGEATVVVDLHGGYLWGCLGKTHFITIYHGTNSTKHIFPEIRLNGLSEGANRFYLTSPTQKINGVSHIKCEGKWP